MATVGTLTTWEQQVITQMRRLQQTSQEWQLTITMHHRKDGRYVQLAPTPYLKVPVQHDAFVALD